MNYNSSLNNNNGISRALQEANDRKARKLTFYKNGEPFSNCITVSIIPGRDFRTMEQFCGYLTEKTNVANGVQYIFTTNGQRVLTLNELEHGMSYVVSGIKNFQPFPYGQTNKLKQIGGNSQGISRSKAMKEDDLKLLRPLSSKFNTVYHYISNQPINTSYKEGRIITIVNNKDHKLRSRVLLNLKSPKSFDIIVKDLGQAVRIKNAKRMFTASGHEVRSVSQLKRDMIGIDLFYLESLSSNTPNQYDSSSMHNKSYSMESINQKNESKQFRASNDRINTLNQINRITRNETNPDINSVNVFKHSGSTIFSDINPSRRGESSSSERLSPNLELIENDYRNGSKAEETQTSPDFVKNSRKNAKKLMKIEPKKSIQSNKLLRNDTNINEENIIQKVSQSLYTSNNQDQNHSPKPKIYTNSPKSTPKPIIKNNPQTKTSKNKKLNPMKTISKDLNESQTSDANRRDALQEYAETLLRETALMVQNENIRQESVESEVKAIPKSKTTERLTTGTTVPTKNSVVSQKENSVPEIKPKENQSDFKNEIIDNNMQNTETETEGEEQPVQQKSPKRIKSPVKIKNITKKLTPIDNQVEEASPQRQNDNESKKPFDNLRDGTDIPESYLKLKWIHGFNGGNGTNNLFILSNGELAFYVGTVAILWNPETNTQRLYTQHTCDINRMAVRKTRNIIATSQEAGKRDPFAVIRVWSTKDLRTYAVLSNNLFGTIVADMDFSIKGSLMVVNGEGALNLTIWDWKNSSITASSKKELRGGESVKGAAFHQTEDDIMVTYGNKHLSIWQQRRDGTIDSRTAIKPEPKASKTISCVDFLPDHSLLTGDTTGTLTIWAPLEDENGILEFVVKEVKAHDQSLTCLQLLQNNILISGDFDGTVKTWDVNDEQFRLLNAIKLPPTSGSITSITRVHYPDRESEAIEIYIGTSMNLILRGSALQATNYTVIFEGHSLPVRGLAVDPKYEFVYSSALDQKICKWNDSSLIWRTTAETQCVSAAVHPSGEVLAVGSVSGTIFIMNASNGTIVSQLPVSTVCIGCLAYSPDGDLLAAGCQDGILYILPAFENGLVYEKVSVLKGPFAILSLQWSIDSQYVLTSVNENNFQELLLWDLPNCRYMKGMTDLGDIIWYDPTCSGGEDVRGIWDNRYLQDVVNLSCHCSGTRKYLVSGDEDGFLRLFSYPCSDSKAGFFEYRQGGGSVTEVRFLNNERMLVSANYGGALFVWQLMPFQ